MTNQIEFYTSQIIVYLEKLISCILDCMGNVMHHSCYLDLYTHLKCFCEYHSKFEKKEMETEEQWDHFYYEYLTWTDIIVWGYCNCQRNIQRKEIQKIKLEFLTKTLFKYVDFVSMEIYLAK